MSASRPAGGTTKSKHPAPYQRSQAGTAPERRAGRKRPRRLASVDLPADPLLGGATPDDRLGRRRRAPRRDAYELDPCALLGVTRFRTVRRPMQSMAALAVAQRPSHRQQRRSDGRDAAAGAAADEEVSPLLRRFLDAIGADGGATATATAGGGAGKPPGGGAVEGASDEGGGQKVGQGTEVSNTSAKIPSDEGQVGAPEAEAETTKERGGAAPPPSSGTGPPTPAAAPPPPVVTRIVEPIDDPNSSTLTRGQHIRYRHLLSELSKLGRSSFAPGTVKAREFRKLRDAVRVEREAYGVAVEEFRLRNADRFLIGFKIPGPASNFVDAGSRAVLQYRERWTGASTELPSRYGRCVQAISLHGVVATTKEGDFIPPDETARTTKAATAFDVDSFAARIVHSTSAGRLSRTRDGWANGLCDPSGNALRPASSGGCPVPRKLLCDDDVARDLAAEHGADVLMTSETFEALLRRPGHESTRWVIPLSTVARGSSADAGNSHVIMEEPIPRPSTTREWLARGFGESLVEAVGTAPVSGATMASQGDEEMIQYVYTLLTIPANPPHGACKVIVRSTNVLLDNHHPIHLRVNLEYFPERGMEEFTHHDRSVWIMDKILQPTVRIFVGRVDPNTARVVSLEAKSVADALAGSSSTCGMSTAQSLAFDASAHFTAVSHVVQGVTKLEQGRHLLCLPGRGLASSPSTSVSVHRECSKSDATEGECIDVTSELDASNSAFTSKAALVACFRAWDWKEDSAERMPFTFPFE